MTMIDYTSMAYIRQEEIMSHAESAREFGYACRGFGRFGNRREDEEHGTLCTRRAAMASAFVSVSCMCGRQIGATIMS